MTPDSVVPVAETTAMEVVQPSALEATERAAIDIQISTAKRYPRSLQAFKARAIDMATIDEETAESCLYRRPVGMKDGQQQYAEGMSVRMAEIVGATYGNLRVRAFIVEQTERFVRVCGQAIDLETNFASSSEVVESTVKKNGQPYDERMRVVIAKAALSKARRDATFQVVPKALARPVETKVRELLMGNTEALEKRRAKVFQWVAKLGIEPKRVWAALGIAGEAELGAEQLETLTGIRTALKDGETTLDEAFPDPRTAGPKQGIGEIVGKPGEQKPAEGTAGGSTAGATTTTPPPTVKTYAPEDRQKFLKEVEDLMLTHECGESRVMKWVKEQGLYKEGQDEVTALDTAVLDKLRAAIPTIKKGAAAK